MVAYYKLQIAKLRREQYGQSSERGRKLLDQLELQLEEAAGQRGRGRDRRRAGRQHDGEIRSPAGSRCGRRFRRICRASAS